MGHGITSTDSMFSVREVPWHGLGVVLPEPPKSIDDALDKAGLGWGVIQRPVEIVMPDGTRVEADRWRANVRSDTQTLLGIVSDEYRVVDNRSSFRFIDAVLNTDLYFETAGSINGGRRVFVTARIPEFIEVAGDMVGTYLYVANGHDGSIAVTSAVTPIRIVCQNTLGFALARSLNSPRTYRFRHTGNLEARYAEARQVMGLTHNYEAQFKIQGDLLGLAKITPAKLERKVLRELFKVEPTMGKMAVINRDRAVGTILDIFRGKGPAGDTSGNAPASKWCAVNAIGEYADYCRRTTKASNQVTRSFEQNDLKQRGFDLVLAA